MLMAKLSKDKIISHYNQGIENYIKSVKLDDLGQSKQSEEFGKYAGDAFFETLEWTYKNHLTSYWDKQRANRKIINQQYNNQIYKLTHNSDLKYLTEQMELYAQPVMASTGINFDVLRETKWTVRNNPVHNGEKVDLSALRKVIPEISKVIFSYVDANAQLKSMIEDTTHLQNQSKWDELFLRCDKFSSKQNSYILITGKCNDIGLNQMELLCKIPWTMVIDFDPDSKKTGLFKAYGNSTGVYPHYITNKQMRNYPFSRNSKVPYWFFAFGDIDVPDTLAKDSREWRRKYYSEMRDFASNFASVFDKNLKIIIANNMETIVEDICSEFDLCYFERAEFIVTEKDEVKYNNFLQKFNTNAIRIPVNLSHIIEGIQSYNAYFSGNNLLSSQISIPAKVADEVLTQDEFLKLEEDFNIIYKGIEFSIADKEDNENDAENFYKGDKISWYGLDNHFDIDRKKFTALRDKVRLELIKGETRLIKLLHEPGVGGTTLSRRVAWEFHEEYPSIILKQYRDKFTALNIVRLYRKTKKPVIVIIEVSDIGLDNAKKLFNEVRIQTISSVFIFVQRTNSDILEENENICINYLTDNECRKIIEKLTPYLIKLYPDKEVRSPKEIELNSIYANKGELIKRSPFYMSLVVFEEDFNGLEDYIKKFMNCINDEQKKILLFVSIVYYYTGKTLSSEFISNLLKNLSGSNTTSKQLILREYFPKSFNLDSLINYEETSNTVYCRPRHSLFAKEIIMQIMNGSSSNREIWKQSLGDYGIKFIQYSAIREGIPSQETMALLKDLFITRGNDEITNEQFSKYIMDLKEANSKESIGRLFKKLVEVYPNEPHFLAHLARYYSYIDKDIQKALSNINRAIECSNKRDAILYHIKGMCIKNEVNDYIRNIEELYQIKEQNKDADIKNLLTLIKVKVGEASEQFKNTRDLNNELPGYISNIEMLIDIVDMGFKLSGFTSKQEFFEESKDSWYLECVDEANCLLESARQYDFYDDGNYIQSVETKVFKLFQNYGKVLETWNNMLPYHPNKPAIRRQIVRAYYQMASGFSRLKPEKRSIILEYLEQNIIDEPDNGSNINLWFQVARHCDNIGLDDAIDRLSKWKLNTEILNAFYYNYALKVVKAVNGNSLAAAEAIEQIREIKAKANLHPNKIKIFEWLSNGKGLRQLLSSKEFEKYDDKEKESHLKVVDGTIAEWKHPGHGIINYNGIEVFFRPAQGNDKKGIYEDDAGKPVKFSFGFSYDGLRAYDSSVRTLEYMANMQDQQGNANSAEINRQNKELYIDSIVDCITLGNGKYHVFVKIDGIEEKCTIYHKDLSNGYNNNNRPKQGEILNAKVINYSPEHGWNLTMKGLFDYKEASEMIGATSQIASEIEAWKKSNKL